jgi:hypothetical protein
LARRNDGGRIELIDDGGAIEEHADIETVALIDRAIERDATETRFARFAQRVFQRESCGR